MGQELEIEETPCEVTEADMSRLDNPNSKNWTRIAPGDEDAARARMEARWATRDAKNAQNAIPDPQK
jgi:hypothetical protein